MSGQKELGSREWVIDQLMARIKTAWLQGKRLSVTDEARRLSQHPACRVPVDDIKEEILVLAVSERTPMELDSLIEVRDPGSAIVARTTPTPTSASSR
jgi:hypothetical protein